MQFKHAYDKLEQNRHSLSQRLVEEVSHERGIIVSCEAMARSLQTMEEAHNSIRGQKHRL